MTNLCTKVTVRKRPIRNGQISLYLDFYPAIRNPRNGQLTRREYLGIYIYACEILSKLTPCNYHTDPLFLRY